MLKAELLPNFFLKLAWETPAGLGAWLHSCGVGFVNSSRYGFAGDYPKHHGHSIFQYTLEGTGYLTFRNVEYTIPKGHGMFLQPPDNYYYHARDKENWRYFFITLDGADAARYWREIQEVCGPVLKVRNDSSALQSASNIVANRYKSEHPVDSWENARDAYNLCLSFLHEITEMHEDNKDDWQTTGIRKAINYVQRNLGEELTVDILARIADMSRFHFSRRFRAHSGMPPGEFILKSRLNLAIHYLEATHLSVKEIAFKVGFNNPNYFARIFHKRMGFSPSSCRKKNN